MESLEIVPRVPRDGRLYEVLFLRNDAGAFHELRREKKMSCKYRLKNGLFKNYMTRYMGITIRNEGKPTRNSHCQHDKSNF